MAIIVNLDVIMAKCKISSNELAEKIVVSVAVNMPFGEYEQVLVPGTHHISVLPNTPVQVNEGVWVCESTHSLTEEDLAVVRPILEATGLVVFVDAALMGIAGTVTGCGPAFVYQFIEALADGGVECGLPRNNSHSYGCGYESRQYGYGYVRRYGCSQQHENPALQARGRCEYPAVPRKR